MKHRFLYLLFKDERIYHLLRYIYVTPPVFSKAYRVLSSDVAISIFLLKSRAKYAEITDI